MTIKQYIVMQGRPVRIQCPRCRKSSYHTVASGIRQKTIRCRRCGKTTLCRFEHREGKREPCAIRAKVIFSSRRKIQVHLCNISPQGLGIVARGLNRSFRIGQHLLIRYRAYGKIVTRKVRVVNISPVRIDLRYADIA